MRLGWLLLFILFAGIAFCQQPAKLPDNFDYGKVESNVYKNQYFGFELPVSATWYIRTKEEMEEGKLRGQKMIEEGNKELAPVIKASEVRNASLLGIFRYRPDTVTGQFNYSLAIAAENLRNIPAISSGAIYLENVQKLMKQSNLSFKVISKGGVQEMGGKKFDLIKVDMTIQGITVHQIYYVAIIKEFATCVIISFVNEQQEKELAGILQGLRFAKN